MRRQEPTRRALVTGGAGFIGSHLCERLLADGLEVICLDNFFTGRKANLRHLLDNPRFDVMRHDVVQPIYVEADEIYNLACPASPVHYQLHPVETIRTSVMGAVHVLELAQRLRSRVLLTSTSEVYGDPEVHPQTEDYPGRVNINGPRACYDEGKRCAESLFSNYHRQHGVDVRIARIFNTYGPRLHIDDGRVVSNFIVQALTNEDITLHGSGEQTRSFSFVSDTVDALVRLMRAEDLHDPVNIGNPEEVTMVELAERVIEITGSRSKLIMVPRPVDDPNRRKPDISRARERLGWEPTTSLNEGLRATVEYFQRRLQED